MIRGCVDIKLYTIKAESLTFNSVGQRPTKRITLFTKAVSLASINAHFDVRPSSLGGRVCVY